MEIQDLYTSSARLVKSTVISFKRYLYDEINWNVRMLASVEQKALAKQR